MTVSDTWSDWKTTAALDTPPSTATPEIDKELRNIKAQVKANVVPGRWTADAAGLTSLITDIGSAEAEVIIDSSLTINPTGATYTIPANITTKVVKPGAFAIANGKTLALPGPLEGGPYQLMSFTGTGKVDLSSCPNKEYPLEWLGGLPDGTDINAALAMYATAFAGTRRFIKLGPNIYTLKTPLVITTTPKSLNIIGSGYHDSQILMDMGPTDIGITIGSTSYWAYSLTMKNFSFTGDTNSCQTALMISQASPANLDLNFWVGSSDFACWIENVVWLDAKIYIRNHLVNGYLGYGEPAKGLFLTNDASTGGENASRLYFDSEAFGVSPALQISPYYSGGGGPCGGLTLTGCCENWTDNPVIVDGIGNRTMTNPISEAVYLKFDNFYIETSKNNVGGTIPISNCALVDISGLIVNDSKCKVELSYTKHVIANPPAYFAGGLTIAPDCQATHIGPILVETVFNDYAGDTTYFNGPSSAGGYANHQPFGAKIQDPTNYIYNGQLSRWQTDIMDGGWGKATSVTYTKETGTIHVLPQCAKMVNASGAESYTTCNLDTYQLQQIKGKYVTFSANFQLKLGDTYDSNPYLQLYFSCAARANSTRYELGQGITVSGATYVCVAVTGNQQSAGSAPSFDTNDGATTVDGNVTWRAGMCAVSNNSIYNQITMTPGFWFPYVVGTFCPTNATAGACVVAQPVQHGGGSGTLYMAEPALMLGRQTPNGYVPNNPNEVLTGSVMISSGSGAPSDGRWACVGDICWNTGVTSSTSPGWVCTTAGVNGTSSTWTAMPNL